MYAHALRIALPLLLLQHLNAAEPLICPGGAALGRFELTVTPPDGGTPRSMQTVNRLRPGDRISYRPLEIDSLEKKKVRIALLLVPSDGSKILVFDPKPANEPASWTAPFEAQLASLVWGPAGLDKAKVASLVAKDNELIGQLAVLNRPMFWVRARGRPENAVFFFRSNLNLPEGEGPAGRSKTLAGDGQRRAFTPVLILFIALSEAKDNADPG